MALLFAIALMNGVVAFEAEPRPDLRPWGALGLLFAPYSPSPGDWLE